MNNERFIKYLMMSLTSDNLKLEEELEQTINSDLELMAKTEKTKMLLSKIVLIETSLAKFTNMMSINTKPEQDGNTRTN